MAPLGSLVPSHHWHPALAGQYRHGHGCRDLKSLGVCRGQYQLPAIAQFPFSRVLLVMNAEALSIDCFQTQSQSTVAPALLIIIGLPSNLNFLSPMYHAWLPLDRYYQSSLS